MHISLFVPPVLIDIWTILVVGVAVVVVRIWTDFGITKFVVDGVAIVRRRDGFGNTKFVVDGVTKWYFFDSLLYLNDYFDLRFLLNGLLMI